MRSASPPKPAVLLFGKSDIGMVREENQDSFLIHSPENEREEFSRGHLLVLADGMGGLAWGGTASQIAVDTIREIYYQGEGDGAEALVRAVKEANRRIYQEAKRLSAPGSQQTAMGSTLTALAILDGRRAIVAQVGDSRAYRISKGGGIQQLTRDHTLVQELADRGEIEPNSLHFLLHRNVLTRGLGLQEEVEVDLRDVPDLQPEDTFLLCSDGLYDVIHDMEIQNWVLSHGEALEEMVEEMLEQARGRGAPDNVTVVVARIATEGKEAARTSLADPAEAAPAAWGWMKDRRSWVLYLSFFLVFALGIFLTLLFSGQISRSSAGPDPEPAVDGLLGHPRAQDYWSTPEGARLKEELIRLKEWLKKNQKSGN
ncbi:MAG: serine/threonine-protein phosphatase [Planctomycetes bacterium]|nr:serine/threonine-protein phosphatase [Planctomycetota bacterium]